MGSRGQSQIMQGLGGYGEKSDFLQWEVTERFQVKEGLDLIYALKDLFVCCVGKRLSRYGEEAGFKRCFSCPSNR